MTEEIVLQLIAELAKENRLVAASQRKTEESLREFQRKTEESHRLTEESLREFQHSTEEFKRNTEEFRRETRKSLKELGQQIGGLGNKFGSFTEGMALPSMTKLLEKWGMESIAPRVKRRKGDETMETDVLAYANGRVAMVVGVEVKSHLAERDLEQMRVIARRFFEFYPEHRDKTLRLVLAYVDAPDDLKRQAQAEGFYTAKVSDETFRLDVPHDFVPGAWRADDKE